MRGELGVRVRVRERERERESERGERGGGREERRGNRV